MRSALKKVISLDFPRKESATDIEHPTAASATSKGSVLLATRDNLSLQWAPRWLQNAGLEVRIATSADEALADAKTAIPSLMICDTSLAAPDGT